MKITVCELPDETTRRARAWVDLVRYLRASPTDVVVLPEMPFCEWEMFRKRSVDPAAWRAALADHEAMMPRLAELETRLVLSSRPVELQGKRLNQAFSWTREDGYRGARAKYYLPDEPDGWEASWFDRGDRDFALQTAGPVAGPVKVGFQLCTELLFSQAAWEIGQRGGQLIAAPRATGGHRRWPMAACLAAIMAGCYVASTNRRSYDGDAFAGRSWLVSPEGEILLETSIESPFLTAEIDLSAVDRARQTYPRNLVIPY
jgi:N-carbamoylputrescine amidase